MPKLDVGVGDEFPAKEVREDRQDPEDETVVHHHHYYRRRRPSGRGLYFVLWVMVVVFLFRLLDFALVPAGAAWNWAWGGWGWGWGQPFGGWGALRGMLMAILIIAGLIWIGRWRRQEDERDAERRERDGR